MPALEVSGLRKVYRARGRPIAAVDGLDLAVPAGGVFGFLGPNGSGKTTTIRALVGHLRPTAGTCKVLGARVPDELERVVDDVGALVETPGFVPALSGRRNLALLARSRGLPVSRVDGVLARVGLGARADQRFRQYSLGMRQRLGVAAALLKEPALLILDEPANGLDPIGMREMRDLLGRLAAEGRTVFVSSHLLSEVEQACDRVAVISRGRCVATGTLTELLARAGGVVCLRPHGDADAAARALADAGYEPRPDGNGRIEVTAPAGEEWRITKALADRSIYVSELVPATRSLEDVFLDLVGRPADAPFGAAQ